MSEPKKWHRKKWIRYEREYLNSLWHVNWHEINKELDCDQEFINYLIYHELAHFKLGTKLHSKEFYELLNSKFGEEKVKILEKRILRKMLEINHISRYFD
jgi:hypothetical protein